METVTGRTCQRWDSQSPHQHNQQPTDFPERNLAEAGSYCRNPDTKPKGPWCYTTEPVWEYCNISLCEGRLVDYIVLMFLLMCAWIDQVCLSECSYRLQVRLQWKLATGQSKMQSPVNLGLLLGHTKQTGQVWLNAGLSFHFPYTNVTSICFCAR
jgi:hypothetical protein